MSSITELLADVKAELGAPLNGRIERAAALALAGAVTRLDDYTWQVASETEPGKVYTITFKLAWSCSCKDFTGEGYSPAPAVEFGGSVQPTCKHILAASACYFSGDYPSPKPAPLYDLCIATKKAPFVSGPDGRILWIKRATDAAPVEPKAEKYLTDSDIAAKLAKYNLVDTEARAGQVIRRYQIAGGTL